MSEREQKHLTAWSDDTALMGPEAPKWNGQIEHLIQYLLTVHKRFGNTCITADLQWGATAMWKRDAKQERIVELEAQLLALREQVGEPYAWTIPGDDTANMNGFIPAKIFREGEFTKPLYTAPLAQPGAVSVREKAAAWDKWSKLICDMQEHNFPHQHSFSYLRDEMRAMLAAPRQSEAIELKPHIGDLYCKGECQPEVQPAEDEAVRKDAERYRHIREYHLQTGPDSWIRMGDDLDEAVDAAIVEEQEGKK